MNTTHSQPITLVVIADTHAKHLDELPPELISSLASADVVVHLGDYTSMELLDGLRQLDNFYGIFGNHDSKLLRSGLKDMDVLEVDGKRLGLFHGFFVPFAGQQRMRALFKKHRIDAILYGHTHFATSRSIDGVFLFNPGSVTGHFPAKQASFGLLTLDGTVSGKIIPLEKTHWAAGGFLGRFGARLLEKTIRWVETWPYPDFTGYTTGARRVLHRLSFRKSQGNPSPDEQ